MAEYWDACDEPEREPDPYVLWHWGGCVGCAVKAKATMMRHPDDDVVQRILSRLVAGGVTTEEPNP